MFTKGKWKAELGYTNIFIIASENDKHSAVADIPTSNDNAEANAHLIAAAPAMYEWIKRVVITKDGWINQADLDEAKGILKEIDNVSS